jgi:hypothetical protein
VTLSARGALRAAVFRTGSGTDRPDVSGALSE